MLYPQREHIQLAQKLFRGEPAITEFDRNFSPIHKSSASVARLVGSDLRFLLQKLHPAHGLLTRFRVYSMRLSALLRLAFALAPDIAALNLAT